MKARLCGRNSRRGAALLVVLCFGTALAVGLGTYITFCRTALVLSTRGMQGTWSVTLAETGMEEALWALNRNDWTGWTIAGSTATKILDGFAFGNGMTGRIELSITNYTGGLAQRVVTATGIAEQPGAASVSRTLKASSERASLLPNAVAATIGRVRFLSGGMVDSYDSSIGDYTAQTPGFSAVISSSAAPSVNSPVQLTSAQVKGYVATTGASPVFGSGALLQGPTTSATTKIDSERIRTSAYQPLFSEVRPTGPGATLPVGTATIGSESAAAAELFYATDLVLSGSDVLTIAGPVVIVVSGSVAISDNAKIHITNKGSLRIHVMGDLTINGNGIQNQTKLPRNLVIISTTNPFETYGMATNAPFYGVIYTPVSGFTVSNSQTIYGAIVARSVTFTASPTIHYDVALRTTTLAGIETPFAINDWRETTF